MKIYLRYNDLLAALLFASKDKTRYVLDCVCLELRSDQARLIATDGRRMVVISTDTDQSYVAEMGIKPGDALNILIPRALINRAKPGGKVPSVTLEATRLDSDMVRDGVRYSLTMGDGEYSITGKSIAGVYPKYAQVITEVKGGAHHLSVSSDLAADFGEANRLLAETKQRRLGVISFSADSETSVVRVILSNAPVRFLGFIMPVRTSDLQLSLPLWFTKAEKAPESVATPEPAKEATP